MIRRNVPLIALSVCQCGFPALDESIELGTLYNLGASVGSVSWQCGGCKTWQRLWAIYVCARGESSAGYLPARLFMIHLKTKPVKDQTQRFGILIEPEFIPTPKASPADNDAELVRAIKEHGTVRIAEFEAPPSMQFKQNYTELTPEQFEAEWMGD